MTLLDVMQLAKRKGQAVFPEWLRQTSNGGWGQRAPENALVWPLNDAAAALIGDGCMSKWLNGRGICVVKVGEDWRERVGNQPGSRFLGVLPDHHSALVAAVVARLNDMPDAALAAAKSTAEGKGDGR